MAALLLTSLCDHLQVDVRSSSLLMTEPLFNLPSIERKTQEMVFEHFGFQAMHAAPAAVLAMHQAADEGDPADMMTHSLSGVVLDAGFSFTHAVPIFDGRVQLEGVQRINLGGKALTNLLKEQVRRCCAPRRDPVWGVDSVPFWLLDHGESG